MEGTFGLAFDDTDLLLPDVTTGGHFLLGYRQLLQLLERYLGLESATADIEFLRVEQYRQLLTADSQTAVDPFYVASFQADPLATAKELLSRRDELLEAGWDFTPSPNVPDRLACLAELEAQSKKRADLPLIRQGVADRLQEILRQLPARQLPLERLTLHEPFELLPPGPKRLIRALQAQGTVVVIRPSPRPLADGSDLAQFQAVLSGESDRKTLRADGSLLVLRAPRETQLAPFLAALLRRNPQWRPACLLGHKSRTLDNALALEGLASMGVPSASLARPTLQVLKLVTAFLWEPLDVQKILEFVSLAEKPIPTLLANRIAALLAQTPGLFSDRWHAVVANCLSHMAASEASQARQAYEFWFNGPRYHIKDAAPKERVSALFEKLHAWGRSRFEEGGSVNSSLLTLANQARRAVELLGTLPDETLDFLQVERIVRTIYEPAPVAYQAAEAGRLATTYQAGAIHNDLSNLIWWEFTEQEPNYFFSRWYPGERNYLSKQSIQLEHPDQQNRRLVWHRQRPVLHTRKQLLLCIPAAVDGSEIAPNPLFGDLQATFGNLSAISWDSTQQEVVPPAWQKRFDLPSRAPLEPVPLKQPEPFFQIPQRASTRIRPYESFTSLEDLIYYPHQWVFRHQLQLRKSSILSVVSDRLLYGNLAHRFIEKLLADRSTAWHKDQLYQWIDQHAPEILRKEGAPLLLYGREPERIAFLERLKYGAWSLVHHLQENGWQQIRTEVDCEGTLGQLQLKGRVDLLAQREEAFLVVDLKYRGGRRYRELIKNEADLQLVLYARMLANPQIAHTAYFSIERAEMIARNNLAFQQIDAVSPDTDHLNVHERILSQMDKTVKWRLAQLQEGTVEVRCRQTAELLEETYGNQLLELLEMRMEDAPFDDYRNLIDLLD